MTMATRAIRTATICHSEDSHTDPKHRRVRIELKIDGGKYVWKSEGNDCGIGSFATVADAENAALQAWGAECWAIKARWIQ